MSSSSPLLSSMTNIIIIFIFLIVSMSKLVKSLELVRDSNNVPCSYFDTHNITDGIMDENKNIEFEGIIYPPHLYGIYNYELINATQKYRVKPHIRGCICLLRPCVRLCCPLGYIYVNRNCIPRNVSQEIVLPVVDNEDFDTERNISLSENFNFVFGKPCYYLLNLDPEEYDDERFAFQSDTGKLIMMSEPLTFYDKNQYCVTYYKSNISEEIGLQVFVCFNDESLLKFTLYPIGMLISVPFLLVTFIVYAAIPELRNLHGKSLMCYVLGLTVGYSVMSVIQMNPVVFSPFLCESIGFMAYFSFMVSFFWLNVMCFDIWWTFRGVRGIIKDAERRKYILYSLYAWGCSLVVLAIAIIMQNADGIPDKFRPGIGETSCFFQEEMLPEFIYLYLPIIILICVNVLLFGMTAYQIRKLQKETAAMTKGDSRKFNKMDADKDRFGLYLRLFIVMGVTWSLEVISWAISKKSWIFYITDACNALQGFFIFVLFVWKPKIKFLIIKRYRSYRGLPAGSKGSHSSTRTSTSHVSMSTTTTHPNGTGGSVVKKSNEKFLMTDIGD